MAKVVTGRIRVKMVNSLLFFSQFSCMVSIKTIDSEAAWKKVQILIRSWLLIGIYNVFKKDISGFS